MSSPLPPKGTVLQTAEFADSLYSTIGEKTNALQSRTVFILLLKNIGSGGGSRTHKISGLSRTHMPILLRRHMATPTGVEPVTFCVTGRRASQLRYGAINQDSIVCDRCLTT